MGRLRKNGVGPLIFCSERTGECGRGLVLHSQGESAKIELALEAVE